MSGKCLKIDLFQKPSIHVFGSEMSTLDEAASIFYTSLFGGKNEDIEATNTQYWYINL